MNNASVKKFQGILENANGNRAKMKEAFKSITAYRASTIAKMKIRAKPGRLLRQESRGEKSV
jgi:hypothetical protein